MARLADGLLRGDDGVVRCSWAGSLPLYVSYHDREWGRPVVDDTRLFEKLCLEGFQAGLSWLTILRKRERFRRVFRGFEIPRVARLGEGDVLRLLRDPGIVRHRGKIESAINNARRALSLQREASSLAAFFWSHEPKDAERPRRLTSSALKRLTETPRSMVLAKELKRRGFTFVGPTTVYAFMQAMGLVNDHIEGCAVREAVERARARLGRPRSLVPGRGV